MIIAVIFLHFNHLMIVQNSSETSKQIAYYADGYHGGFYGHMPDGSFRDILNAMERYPRWKICLEIEPVSYGYLKSSDHGVKKMVLLIHIFNLLHGKNI